MNNKLFYTAIAMTIGFAALEAQVTTVPYETKGSHLYIKVAVDNHGSLNFVFDSGTTGAMIDKKISMKPNQSCHLPFANKIAPLKLQTRGDQR